MSIYLDLTREFNRGRLRAVLTSGQAVVLLRLTIASKDGDWILREDEEALDHVLAVLEAHGARYRFGAPLDVRWHRHGWSSHFEFDRDGMRIRTDFFTQPPRVSMAEVEELFRSKENEALPFTGPRLLLAIKRTAREKDWPIVGELARLLEHEREQLLHSRSAEDLLAIGTAHPALASQLKTIRPALAALASGRDALRMELERERFAAMDADRARIRTYLAASAALSDHWAEVQDELKRLPLTQAHRTLLRYAERWLPTNPTPPETSS